MKILNVISLAAVLISLTVVSSQAEPICFKCHEKSDFQGVVVHKPVKEGRCTSCHNPHVARFAGLLQQKVKALCYSCHDAMGNDTEKSLVHKPVRDGNCLACHDPHASKVRGLLKANRVSETCFGCHDKLDKNYPYSHTPYARGECSACHSPHQSGEIQLLRKAPEKLCRSCHKGELKKGHSGFPEKPGACLTCHNPHGSSRPGMIREVLHAPFAEGCDSCHEGGPVKTDKCLECHEDVKDQLRSVYSHLTGKGGNSCINCHSPHAADNEKLFRNRQTQVCRACHLDTFAHYIDKLYSHPDTGSCADCHSIHGTVNLVMLRGDGNQVCSRCHESQGQFTHPIGEGVLDPRTGLNMTCVSCHYPHGTNFKFNLKLSGAQDLCVQCHKGY